MISTAPKSGWPGPVEHAVAHQRSIAVRNRTRHQGSEVDITWLDGGGARNSSGRPMHPGPPRRD